MCIRDRYSCFPLNGFSPREIIFSFSSSSYSDLISNCSIIFPLFITDVSTAFSASVSYRAVHPAFLLLFPHPCKKETICLMHSGKQLQPALGGGFTVQFFAQIRIQTFQYKWIILRKPCHIALIFLRCDRTCAVNQNAAGFYIRSCIVKDLFLKH